MFIKDLYIQRLDQDLIKGYLKELNILNTDISDFGLDLYKLNRLFLDFFLFFDRISNNHSSSGFSIEVQSTRGTIEKTDIKEDPHLSST